MDTTMAAKNAVQKPETLNPLTRAATSRIISALMTSRKNPKVTMVSGRVTKMRSGRTTALANPSSSAETNSDCLSRKDTPWKMWLTTQSERVMMPQCRRKWLRLCNMAKVYTLRGTAPRLVGSANS